MNKVYAFQYCFCIHESGWDTISLHKSIKGAYKAMNKFINERYIEERESNISYGKWPYKILSHEDHRITTLYILE